MGYYDPLQYPILFPFETHSWDIETKTNVGKNVTCREFAVKSGRLLQQYVIDNYVKIETGRLRWNRRNQNDIRSEVYQRLQDALHNGENDADNVGQRTILPSSFIGSKRDMTQRYQYGMAIILNNDEHILLSFDEVRGDTHNLYQHEYLHKIAPGTLPPHILKIKLGNLLDVEILTGHNTVKRAFLPRIKLKTTDGAGLPFELIRKQFPVKLSFAITINKSQGKTIPNVIIYLPRHVFSHGQLYVALSRGVSRATTRVQIKDGRVEMEEGDFTKNIVFKEILLSQTHVFIYYV
ncbi:uncharacterized protein LOC127093000 [Lathyrus oleraceus]|uniref:uncharacterized protein LOC127093000 n=1 Tax=Pisum sativum TaxID=3888 RepID=UPI0021D0D460|nr:uncharacterized protein LOC127093000 [Pisum sativum]